MIKKDKMAEGTLLKGFACPTTSSFVGPTLRAWNGSFYVFLDLERTQNYCVELLNLYLRRMRKLQKQSPPTVHTEKASTCCNSLPACEKVFPQYKKGICCLLIALLNGKVFTWIVILGISMQYPTNKTEN